MKLFFEVALVFFKIMTGLLVTILWINGDFILDWINEIKNK
jgi:hypothetical protein